MIGESADGMTGEPVYCALMKGTFSLDSMEFKTKGEKEEQPETTKLTGDWMNRNIEVDGDTKGIVYGYHEGKQGADEFMKKYSLVLTDQFQHLQMLAQQVTQIVLQLLPEQ